MPDRKKKILLSKFQNGPIRKVNMLKSKFDDIFVPAPLCHHGSALRKFFDQKKKKKFNRLKMVQFAKLTG